MGLITFASFLQQCQTYVCWIYLALRSATDCCRRSPPPWKLTGKIIINEIRHALFCVYHKKGGQTGTGVPITIHVKTKYASIFENLLQYIIFISVCSSHRHSNNNGTNNGSSNGRGNSVHNSIVIPPSSTGVSGVQMLHTLALARTSITAEHRGRFLRKLI